MALQRLADPRIVRVIVIMLVCSAIVLVIGGAWLLTHGGPVIAGVVLCLAGLLDLVLAFALWQRTAQ